MFLDLQRVVLRRFTDDDLATFLAYRNDPDVARYQSWESCTEAQGRRFIENQKHVNFGAQGEGCQLGIELKATSVHIGDCYFKVDSFEPRQAEIGFTLASAYHGYGYATEAVSGLLDYFFGTLKLHRVVAYAQIKNAKSIALLERLKFTREGQFRQSIWNDGQWEDEYFYGILENDWNS